VDNPVERADGILDKYFDPDFSSKLHGDEEGTNKMEKILFQIESSIRDIVESILAGDLDVPPSEKGPPPPPLFLPFKININDAIVEEPPVPWVIRGQQAQAQLAEVTLPYPFHSPAPSFPLFYPTLQV
jgi:hypothetical protein